MGEKTEGEKKQRAKEGLIKGGKVFKREPKKSLAGVKSHQVVGLQARLKNGKGNSVNADKGGVFITGEPEKNGLWKKIFTKTQEP